jgi:DNA-directed RNA polymerase subunit beta
MTPEEKLLRAIFGEKASDVRDTSLARAAGCEPIGRVVEVRVFNRHGIDKDERAMAIEREEIERLAKDRDDEQAILDRNVYGRLPDMLVARRPNRRSEGLQERPRSPPRCSTKCPRSQWWQFALDDDALMGEIEALHAQYDESKKPA